jgi:hypothetical protein
VTNPIWQKPKVAPMNVRQETITGFEQHAEFNGSQTKTETIEGNAVLRSHVPGVALKWQN